MVDSRKSLHAKQQRRRANGEFAEEQDTGLPSGDTLTDFERKRLNNAMLAAETNIIMDPDVADYSQYAASRLDELVARPAKPGETDDMPSSSPISVTTLWRRRLTRRLSGRPRASRLRRGAGESP